MLTIVAAKAAGANKIFVFDLSEERLAKAKSVGATHVYNSGNVDPVQTVYEHTDNGVDVSFEVAGVGITLQQSIEVTRPWYCCHRINLRSSRRIQSIITNE